METAARKKILAIDDDREICDAMETILSGAGYDVACAQDTATAARMMEVTRPDLLILDISMATVDEGFEFARRVKKKEGVFGVPILIVSARPPTERGYDRAREEDMDWIHADIFMDKPVDPHDLIHNVQVLIGEPAVATA